MEGPAEEGENSEQVLIGTKKMRATGRELMRVATNTVCVCGCCHKEPKAFQEQ